MTVRLEQIVPRAVLEQVHRINEQPGEGYFSSGAPVRRNAGFGGETSRFTELENGQLAGAPAEDGMPPLPSLDFIAPPPMPNPLAQQGLAEVGIARSFMEQVERRLIEKSRHGAPKPWLTPTRTPDEEIAERLAPSISQAAGAVAQWLNQDCNGNMALMQRVLDRFWAKWAVERFASPDLSSLLMMAYEEVLSEEGGKPVQGLESWPALRIEPAVLRPLSEPMAVSVQTQQILLATRHGPERPDEGGGQEPASIAGVQPAIGPRREDEVEVRLVSVREMLRRYFQGRPAEYAAALAGALDLERGNWNASLIGARLSSERSRVGAAGVCIKLWQVVRGRHSTPPRKPQEVAAWGAAPLEEPMVWELAPRWLPLDLGQKLRLLMGWIEQSEAG